MNQHCFILPPHLLEAMARSPDARVRASAVGTLLEGQHLVGQRDILARLQQTDPAAAAAAEYKVTYDAGGRNALPGRVAWEEGFPLTGKAYVDEATEGARLTYEVLYKVFGRAGLDGKNMRMVSTVRFGNQFNNAYWQGRQMVYGSGDGYTFNRFTIDPDIPAHELTHGVTQFSCALQYYGQAGALNEHFSDVLGIVVKQYKLGQDAGQSDWLLGAGLFTGRVKARGLRDMLNPGTAYDDPNIGKDPQPAHMRDFVNTDADSGGVHINSGILNRAFALAARAIGGKSWDGAAHAWFVAHTARGVPPWCDFNNYAQIVVRTAGEIWGNQSSQADAVKAAWSDVGVF